MSITEGTTEKKPVAKKARKAAPRPSRPKVPDAGEFGERPDTLKGKLMAMLVKGKPVRIADAKKSPLRGRESGPHRRRHQGGDDRLREGRLQAAKGGQGRGGDLDLLPEVDSPK